MSIANRCRGPARAALLLVALAAAPAVAHGQQELRSGVTQHIVMKFQGLGPEEVHVSRIFSVPRAWQVHWLFSCVDRPGRPSIFSIILANPKNFHRAVRNLTTTIASQGRGSARQKGAGTYRLRIVSPCVWNIEVTR